MVRPWGEAVFGRWVILAAALSVVALRYLLASYLAAFFSPIVQQWGIDAAMTGLIFASYPFGMALTSVFGPMIVRKLGTRNAVLAGLAFTAVTTILFGFIPTLIAEPSKYPLAFLLTYYLNGQLGSIAETAAIILVAANFQDMLGSIMASINTISGVGCMAGPLLGGVLYDLPSDPTWAFRLPFIVCSLLSLILIFPMAVILPNAHIAGDEKFSPEAIPAIASRSNLLGFAAIMLSGLAVATLDPTLSYRLSSHPFLMSPSLVSVFFMYSSIVYVIINIPLGCLVDLVPRLFGRQASRIYKLVTALGFVTLCATFLLLAPAQWPLLINPSFTIESLNNVSVMIVAMGLKGIGSALSNVAIYPDLVSDVPRDDELALAAITGLWNAAYALGWALGPLIGGYLYDALKTVELCVGRDATSEQCVAIQHENALSVNYSLLADSEGAVNGTFIHVVGSNSLCACAWRANNGFDGMAQVIGMTCLGFATLLAEAIVSNVGGSNGLRPWSRLSV